MRGFAVAVSFFILMLSGAAVIQSTLEKTSKNVVAEIDRLADEVEKKQWENADKSMTNLEKKLHNTAKWIAMFVEHAEIDNIIMSFAAVKEYEKYRDIPEMMAETATLRELIEHIPRREALSLENIL
ncbi:MAG: DUF4363 family protein [Clostridia bacterium]|nr:DUF4363 family protein [Clostridia bacterium]